MIGDDCLTRKINLDGKKYDWLIDWLSGWLMTCWYIDCLIRWNQELIDWFNNWQKWWWVKALMTTDYIIDSLHITAEAIERNSQNILQPS